MITMIQNSGTVTRDKYYMLVKNIDSEASLTRHSISEIGSRESALLQISQVILTISG